MEIEEEIIMTGYSVAGLEIKKGIKKIILINVIHIK
jgi:hypothetical protein